MELVLDFLNQTDPYMDCGVRDVHSLKSKMCKPMNCVYFTVEFLIVNL